MPRSCFWTCLLATTALAGQFATGKDEFPYHAYVAVPEAEVVSGPGHRYYATERLPFGAKIEVYREEHSGWLAIRPTEAAFSWVPAESIEQTGDNNVGRVLEPTAAWIGTAAEQVSEHRQQVTMKAGELVQILGEKRVSGDGDEEQSWLKIAPPAGEFRWIHLRDVSRQRPDPEPEPQAMDARETRERQQAALAELRSMLNVPSDASNSPSEAPGRFRPAENAIALEDLAEPAGSRIAQAQFRSAVESKSSLSPDGFVPRKRRPGSEQLHPAPSPAQRMVSVPARTAISSNSLPRLASAAPSGEPASTTAPLVYAPAGDFSQGGVSADELARRLERIELDLSQMLSQDRSLWNLAEVKERVDQLVERGMDPHSRGRARLLLEKVEQFEQAFQVDEYGPIGAIAGSSGTNRDDTTGKVGSLADPRYDGEGWLKPVVSRKSDQPLAPYALVDRDGKPLCFVTPTPGLNVHRYLNKQVGVYGRRGYIEELKTAHVVAERVIALEGTLR